MPDRRGIREFDFPALHYLFVEKSVFSPADWFSSLSFPDQSGQPVLLPGFFQSPAAVEVRLAQIHGW